MPLNKEVQVYLPSYAPSDEYLKIDYNNVSAIIYSFMRVSGDGSLTPESGYNPDPLISYAHQKGVKVILSIQDISQNDADTMLGNVTNRTNAINNIYNEVISRGYDGVDNDIEKATRSEQNKTNMVLFQQELSNKFWNSDPNYRLSIAISAYWPDTDNMFDVSQLQNYSDFIMIMGYDWYGPWSTTAGPNAPNLLDSGNGNFDTIKHYEGLMDKTKLIYGIPYYGREYQTFSDQRLANISSGGTISDIVYDEYITSIWNYTRYFDPVWQTPWYVRQSGTQWYQGHYDNIRSLRQKYELVLSEGIAGIGIWDISQGTGNIELWNLIASKFYTPPSRYRMNVSISIFGDAGYNVNSMISEYINFVSSNSFLDINATIGYHSPLQDSEFGSPDVNGNYFVYPGNLLSTTKALIPSNVQVNILMYDWKNKPPAYAGGALGGDSGIYPNVPYIGIPLGSDPTFETKPWGNWGTVIAQRITHEWMHGLKWILDSMNFSGFPTVDGGVCEPYGFTSSDGWYSCYQLHLNSFLSTAMYNAINNRNQCPQPAVQLII